MSKEATSLEQYGASLPIPYLVPRVVEHAKQHEACALDYEVLACNVVTINKKQGMKWTSNCPDSRNVVKFPENIWDDNNIQVRSWLPH